MSTRMSFMARIVLVSWLLSSVMSGWAQAKAGGPGDMAKARDNSPCLNKRTRTPAQKKINSQLLCALYPPESPDWVKPTLRTDDKGRVLVEVRTDVTSQVLSRVRKLGGEIVSQADRHHSIRAYVPLSRLEELAESAEVRVIMPAPEAMTR